MSTAGLLLKEIVIALLIATLVIVAAGAIVVRRLRSKLAPR